jgi:hypothetical protein
LNLSWCTGPMFTEVVIFNIEPMFFIHFLVLL